MNETTAETGMDVEDGQRLDAEAVARTLAGDTTAYDRLIERYQRRAVSVSYRLLGNIEEAMDVCQDAFLKAFRSLATLKEHRRFGSWLMRIVSNLSLNARRGRRPMLSLATDEEGDGVSENWAAGRSQSSGPAADPIQASELQQAIGSAIDSLPEAQRMALVLFAIEQMPQKEVAEIMECSVEMVKWNVFQARKTLRLSLAEYLEE